MPKVSRLAVYHTPVDEVYLPLRNEACPIWIEGTISDTSISVLEFTVELSVQATYILNYLQFEIVNSTVPALREGKLFKLSVLDTEKIRTWSENYFLPPWQEAKLRVDPKDDAANDTKALLMWINYWVGYAVNSEVEPYLYIEVDPF